MSKGSKRRPQKVSDRQMQSNWDKIFKDMSAKHERKKKADEQEIAILLDNIASNLSRVYGVSKKKLLKPIPKGAGKNSLYVKLYGKKKEVKK